MPHGCEFQIYIFMYLYGVSVDVSGQKVLVGGGGKEASVWEGDGRLYDLKAEGEYRGLKASVGLRVGKGKGELIKLVMYVKSLMEIQYVAY